MKTLSAAQRAQHDDLSGRLDHAKDTLEAALRRFDERARELWAEEVDPCVEAFNDAIEKAEAFRNEIEASMDDHSAEKSDQWLESAIGKRFQEWRTAWESSFDTIELDADDALQDIEVNLDVVETFTNMPLERDDA